MKEDDNAEGRKIRPAFLPLSAVRNERQSVASRPIRSVSTTTGNGREGGDAIVHTILLGGLLSLAWGRGEKTEGKQDAGVQRKARDICYQNGNALLC